MTALKLASSNNIEMDKPREYDSSGVKKERKKEEEAIEISEILYAGT